MESTDDKYELHPSYYIPLIALIVLMFISSLFFFILLIKSKAFNKYQCYNIIIFILIMIIDCFVRIIPFSDDDPSTLTIWEYLQAFLLTFFDKIILATITTQIILFYLGVIHTKTFVDNDKITFYISFAINIIISVVLTIIYIINGSIALVSNRRYLYCQGSKSKEILDPIFNSVYLIANLYCSIFLLMYLFRKIKDVENGLTEDYDYKYNFKKTLIMTLLNLITFLESYLIIFDVLSGEATDLIYLITLFIIILYNCLNKTTLKEAMKIFCIDKYKRIYGNEENKNNKEEDEDDLIHSRTYST